MTEQGDKPLVSVCIQTYQHAPYIRECIDSVLMQETNFPFEIILGEDDSTDGTREICIEYHNRHPDIIRLFLRSEKDKIYINDEKTGRFNYIQNLKEAKGRYIALLDGDDYWISKNKLQQQADYMISNPDCSISFHKIFWVWNKGRSFIINKNLPFVNTKFTLEDLIREYHINSCSTMFLQSNISDMPAWFFDVPFLDYPLNIHNAGKGKVGYIADTMAVYRLHRTGMWSSKRAPQNLIRLWRLYSIMATNIFGETGIAMAEKRHRTGIELIRHYKNHLWESKIWLQKELEVKKFVKDEILLKHLSAKRTFKNYLFNGFFLMKFIALKIFKKS